MSIELMNKAFKANLPPASKLLLIALCDYANDDGICYPSLKTIQSKVNLGKTNITYILKSFELLNVIERSKRKRENGSYTSTIYTIKNIDNISYDKFQKAYQEVKKYIKSSLSEQYPQNDVVNMHAHKSEHLETSTSNHHSNLSSKREDFNTFRKRIIEQFSGKPLAQCVPSFLKETVISLSKAGYLHNEFSHQDLDRSDAIMVWNWLYENQHMLLNNDAKNNISIS